MNAQEEYQWRWAELEKLQEHYVDFRDFYADCSETLLGFTPTWMQYDIAEYVCNGPLWSMVQAQRGEAKTTIAGCYAVWCLIHDPGYRILVLSAGSAMAKQISTWCIAIINGMPELEILRCDKSHPGARASVEAYDVHYQLKGANKSPSIACLGVTSNMQGYRADLLMPDDIESSKNALTQLMREQLAHLTRDFSSINSEGKILYLGTPQSIDSVYNSLPSRGFDVRIWPGRFPSEKDQEEVYGDSLAPSLRAMLYNDPSLRTGYGLNGLQGAPTDPEMMGEEILLKKVVDQGLAYFNLQFMLNTALMDSDKYPLKLHNLMFYEFDPNECPGKFWWTNDVSRQIPLQSGTSIPKERLFRVGRAHEEYFLYSTRLMSIDPAGGGQNGDETGIAILYEVNGYVVGKHITGIKGGTSQESMAQIVALAKEFKVNEILCEKNFGFGIYTEAVRAAMIAAEYRCSITEIMSSGQKELRIIDSIEPLLGIHKIVLDSGIIEHDIESTMHYPAGIRSSYQFLFQMSKITRNRGSLNHDDRLEAFSQGVRFLADRIAQDAQKAIDKKKQQKLVEMQQDPNGLWRASHTTMAAIARKGTGGALSRFGGAPGQGLLNRRR